MLTVNILSELQEIAKKRSEEANNEAEQFLNSVKGMLEGQDENEKKVMKLFGTSKIVTEKQKHITDSEKFKSGKTVTVGDIEVVCKKYALKCLPVAQYKQNVPKRCLAEIAAYLQKNKISIEFRESELKIIAPKSHFNPVIVDKDPIVVFIHEGVADIITTWGSDFTYFRRILGFIKQFFVNFFTFWLICSTLLVTLTRYILILNGFAEVLFPSVIAIGWGALAAAGLMLIFDEDDTVFEYKKLVARGQR